VLSRVKSPESILDKARRRGTGFSFEEIREAITDIAGVRVTCSFVSDVYRVFDMLAGQPDLTVLQVKDYIAHPKPNGYRSLHTLVQVPVHLSDRIVPVTVEVQLRTVAMDFWASLEHKIYDKFSSAVPDDMQSELREAAHPARPAACRGRGRRHVTGHQVTARDCRATGPTGPTVGSGPVTGRGRPAPEDHSQKETS
jgi:putative GTP pyrophosphokinase